MSAVGRSNAHPADHLELMAVEFGLNRAFITEACSVGGSVFVSLNCDPVSLPLPVTVQI